MKLSKLVFVLGAVAAQTACVSGSNLDDILADDSADSGTTAVMMDCNNASLDSAIYSTTAAPPYLTGITRTGILTAAGMTIEATTCGYTTTVVLNAFQTGVDLAQGWDEEHIIPSIGYTAATETTPPLDHVKLDLTHTLTLPQTAGVNTLFDATDGTGLTYVLRVYNATNVLTECAVWGDAPDDVIAQVNLPTGNPQGGASNATEINATNCQSWN